MYLSETHELTSHTYLWHERQLQTQRLSMRADISRSLARTQKRGARLMKIDRLRTITSISSVSCLSFLQNTHGEKMKQKHTSLLVFHRVLCKPSASSSSAPGDASAALIQPFAGMSCMSAVEKSSLRGSGLHYQQPPPQIAMLFVPEEPHQPGLFLCRLGSQHSP